MPDIMLHNLHELSTSSLFLQYRSHAISISKKGKLRIIDLRMVTKWSQYVSSTVRRQSHVCLAPRFKLFDLAAHFQRSHLGKHQPTDTLHWFNQSVIQSINQFSFAEYGWSGMVRRRWIWWGRHSRKSLRGHGEEFVFYCNLSWILGRGVIQPIN